MSCSWAPPALGSGCPDGGPCPIVLDEVLYCGIIDLADLGLRVVPAPDATWLATTSGFGRYVYRLAGGKEAPQDAVPEGFQNQVLPLGLAPDGTVHVGGYTPLTSVASPGGPADATFANGAWSTSFVYPAPGMSAAVVDLEVGSDGAPRMWLSDNTGFSLATPSGTGAWTLASAPLPATTMGVGMRFRLASDGSIVSLAFDGVQSGLQLHALVGGVERTIGGPLPWYADPFHIALTDTPAPTSPGVPLFAVGLPYADGVHVFAESASAPETETLIPGTTAPALVCVPPSSGCSGTCHETASGMERNAYALAWTDDGVAWLAYVVTHLDQNVEWTPQSGGADPCTADVVKDSSTATLHLVRVPLDGSAPKEALAIPIDRPGSGENAADEARYVDARGFGKDLAIGVRTGWDGTPVSVRVLRIDTTQL